MHARPKCIPGFIRAFTIRKGLATRFGILSVAMLACTKVSAVVSSSGLINFDYYQAEVGKFTYGPGAAAIGANGDLWNTASLLNPYGPLSLFNAAGNMTGAKWSLAGSGGAGAALEGPYAGLVDISVTFTSASITGLIPNQSYDLYVYSVYWNQTISVNGVNFTTPGLNSGSVDTLTAGNQYAVHTVTADSSGALAFVPVASQYGNNFISSWQLTPVPEPSITSLVGLAWLAFVARQHKRPARPA